MLVKMSLELSEFGAPVEEFQFWQGIGWGWVVKNRHGFLRKRKDSENGMASEPRESICLRAICWRDGSAGKGRGLESGFQPHMEALNHL